MSSRATSGRCGYHLGGGGREQLQHLHLEAPDRRRRAGHRARGSRVRRGPNGLLRGHRPSTGGHRQGQGRHGRLAGRLAGTRDRCRARRSERRPQHPGPQHDRRWDRDRPVGPACVRHRRRRAHSVGTDGVDRRRVQHCGQRDTALGSGSATPARSASAGSRWVAGSGTSRASTASRSTTCWPPTS